MASREPKIKGDGVTGEVTASLLFNIKLLEPLEAAVMSIVPVKGNVFAIVKVTGEALLSPKTTLELVPETVQAASVVALFSIL